MIELEALQQIVDALKTLNVILSVFVGAFIAKVWIGK